MVKKIKLVIEKGSIDLVSVYYNGVFINSYVDVKIDEDANDYFIEKNGMHITLFNKSNTTIEYVSENENE